MCKLCKSNTKNESFDLSTSKSKSRSQLAIIGKEYTGEYPCMNIYHGYSCRPNKSMSIDAFIIQRLTTKYIYSNVNFKAWQKKNIKQYMKNYVKKNNNQEKISASAYVRTNTIRKTLEQNIFESKNISSKTIVYRVRFYAGKDRRTKSFKTLEEARQFKQEVLNGNHNQHNSVAA